MGYAMKILAMSIVCGAVVSAQGNVRRPIEGVWKVTEIVVTGAGASSVSNAQPSLLIFTRTHYSIMYVPGDKPRTLRKAADPRKAEDASAEEKAAAYDSIIANAGTYQLEGSTITIRPIVSKDPNYMGGGFNTYRFRIDGTTLSLTSKSSDLNERIGGTVVASEVPASETRMTLARLE